MGEPRTNHTISERNVLVVELRLTWAELLPRINFKFCIPVATIQMNRIHVHAELSRWNSRFAYPTKNPVPKSASSGEEPPSIKKEFDASIVYLKYAAYFAQEKINLPGFEKFFFHAAGEEREHGIKLIEYALMRGKEPVNKNTFQLDYSYKVPAATTGLSALEDALKMEQEVTLSIRNLIKTCEGDKDDYHLVDYLTGEYLNEQHKGQGRKLAEFLFDKNHM
ncbi:ferritin heavy chain-like protein [Culex quinquefasciatus]|uniref:Ferritin n=1 Tax=Culex quinquefasciatus TaxID=7176 RepID=B0XFD7_CULQU|nr:ferritin heavy chain-like protein [Culex quinquefasciatus]|eukprot:XP_001868359.1 ferritin heavy chain-like protein [Culex quinquefasciatus]